MRRTLASLMLPLAVLAGCAVLSDTAATDTTTVDKAPTPDKKPVPMTDASLEVDTSLVALAVFARVGGDDEQVEAPELSAEQAAEIVDRWPADIRAAYDIDFTVRGPNDVDFTESGPEYEECTLTITVGERGDGDSWVLEYCSPEDGVRWDAFVADAFSLVADPEHPLVVSPEYAARLSELTGINQDVASEATRRHAAGIVEERLITLTDAIDRYRERSGRLPQSTQDVYALVAEVGLDEEQFWEFPAGTGFKATREGGYTVALTDGYGITQAQERLP